MKNIIPTKESSFIVVSNSPVTSFDRKVLTRLYQPIVGAIAFSLYLTLLSELEFDCTVSKESRPHSSILDLTRITLDEFIQSTSKLEAVGLIKTKFNKTSKLFSYSLFAPKDPSTFLEDPFLDNLLRQALTENEYQRNRLYFKKPSFNEEEFEDISQKFNDVYEIDCKQDFHGGKNIINKQSATINVNFDFDLFYKKIAEYQISKRAITKDVESHVAALSVAHNIPAIDMASLVHKSLNQEGKVSINKLQELCSTNAVIIDRTVAKVNTGNKSLDALINTYNENDPYEFLVLKNNGAPISSSDRRIVASLLNDYHLTGPVVNALIDYCLEANDNILSKNYAEKLASSLTRAKIDDSLSAVRYLRRSIKKTEVKKVEVKDPIVETKVEVKTTNDDEDLDKNIEESLAIIKNLMNKGGN